jgi:glycerol-3-phosphate dehydrogenase
LYANEVDYLCDIEWATTSQDILWRRSKLGLSFTQKETAALDAYLTVKTHSTEAA